ncbi:ribose-5-phosphate isomerase RpiA [Buchnera aphidicola (Neophyllaphis podocarpi)]|uniref:ribose-5-phosphate isomerase RpiA n=1 Tax=Buchnera aphidicola TaxID=9 RepID=UPI0031B8A5A4
MNQDQLKKSVGYAVIDFIPPGSVIGIGTGTTIINFITHALRSIKHIIKGTVSSSIISTTYLKQEGIKVFDLNQINSLVLYIDSADEINSNLEMIKGGGGALTKEKIISNFANKFICIVDESKKVECLGKFPVPIEIIPLSYNYISKEIIKLGGIPVIRSNIVTENNNIIIDVHNLDISNPLNMENFINSLPGVVTVGIFANRTADIALIGTNSGIKTMRK